MIVPMAQVEILGPRSRFSAALALLQEKGVMQLRSPVEALEGELPSPTTPTEEEAATTRRLEAALARIASLLADWPRAPRRPGLALPEPTSPAFVEKLDAISAERRALDEKRARLAEEREVVGRYGGVLQALAAMRPALAGELHTVGLVMDPDAVPLLEAEARRVTGGEVELQSRPAVGGKSAVLLSVPQPRSAAIERLLFEQSVDEIKLPAHLAGESMLDALARLCRRERELPDETRALEAELTELGARWLAPLEAARGEMKARLGRLSAAAEGTLTRHAFVLFGWVEKARLPGLITAVKQAFDDEVAVVEHPISRARYGQVPVVLQNPPFLRPFELLLSLVPPPRYGSIDPTPYLALFFPLFFGLMLGDVGLGLLLLGLALLVRWRDWFHARRAAPVALACAVSAIVFGVLFGEVFGDLGRHLGLRPIILHRSAAIFPSLALALAIGTVHIFVGVVLGIVDAARGHEVRELLVRIFRLVLLLLLPLTVASFAHLLPRSVAYGAALAFGALLLAALVSGGPLGAIELVLTLGNILSYSRLMALGLASVMLAEVANRIGVEVRPFALGGSIAIVLHAANFALGLISPTVCALRLQYVEFFDKFYEEGSRRFRPFGTES